MQSDRSEDNRPNNLAFYSILALLAGLACAEALLFAEAAFAQSNNIRYTEACGRLIALMEGPFGALITVGAGVGAIIASAVGGFRTAWTLVVVAVGAFILRAYITLFFAPCFATGAGVAGGVGGAAINIGVGGPAGGIGFGVGGPAVN